MSETIKLCAMLARAVFENDDEAREPFVEQAMRAKREHDEMRRNLDASDTTRREWEVRAAESYADGRKAGLREAAEACDAQAESWPESPESWFADPGMRHEAVTRRAHRNEAKSCAAKIRRALAPPAAETVKGGA